MGYLFKHLAVRFWTTMIIGSLLALIALPPVAALLGPGWMVVPVLGLFGSIFWVTGIAFAAAGRRRLDVLLSEAAVWDRAGMRREARQAFIRAVDTVDSFLFSPWSRRGPSGRLLAQMTRFQLAQTEPEASTDALVEAYLRYFPSDRDAAIKWLEGVLPGREVTAHTQDIAARIGAAHASDMTVQRMLARFYLDERRSDFTALKTYRRLMDAGEPPSDDLLTAMADLFLAQPRADTLALRVYLAEWKRRDNDPRLRSAIAASCSRIPPSPDNRPLLEQADTVLADIDAGQRSRMARAFMPQPSDGRPIRSTPNVLVAGGAVSAGLRQLGRAAGGFVSGAGRLGQRLRRVLSSGPARAALKWSAMGLFIVGVGWLLVNTALHLAATFTPTEVTPEPVVSVVTDPFTLQVAAYLKESDAQRYVDQLQEKGLEAYWTRASGSGKAWYQVRISHYKTKADARSVGESLKKRGLIGDYYVANYKRPDVP